MKKHICYLCGKQIEGKPSKEHVPPKQFFAQGYRKASSPSLLTLLSHTQCNKSYQADEDYFVASVGGTAQDTPTGQWLLEDIVTKLSRQDAQGLRNTIMSEFSDNVSGIYLPRGLIAKKLVRARVDRVVWKIIRGLYFHHYSQYLDQDSRHKISYYQMGRDSPPEEYKLMGDAPLLGQYRDVFAYRFKTVVDEGSTSGMWALFFWKAFIAIAMVLIKGEVLKS